jgi:GT2 family glycosyltransferase
LVSGEEAILMSEPGVTIVIPVWNGRDLLLKLLEKLRGQTCPIVEILAVDNGSTDGAAEAAEGHGARVLRLGENRGFSGAVNHGIEACRTELVAVVNSDVEPEGDWLARLVQALDSPECWFATGKTLSAGRRDQIDGTYDLLSRGACAWRAGNRRADCAAFLQPRPINIAPGTAALFRRELFRRVGLLDTAFESYLEDVDFGLRCALAGFGGAYVPEAVAYHWGSASLGRWNPKVVRLIARNQVYLAAKHFPLREYWWPILVGQLLWGVVALRHGTGWAFLKGKLAALNGPRPHASGASNPLLAKILQDHELQIREAQRRTGFDWYWRVYFLLTSSAAD